MGRISVQTSEETYIGLIDEGQYIGRCETMVEVNKKDGTGTQLETHFKVQWNDKDVSLVRFTPLMGPGVGFTREVLDGLGVKYEEGKDARGNTYLEFDSDDCLNKECMIDVTHQSYNGQIRNSVGKITRLR